jgi:thioredoxin
MKKINSEDFRNIVGDIDTLVFKFRGNKPIIVDFYSETCKPCQQMMPIIEDVEKMFGDRVEFYKIDADDNWELANFFNVVGLPTLVMFHVEKERMQLAGLRTKDKLIGNINKFYEF